MSIELVLFVVVFLVLPLVMQMMNAARKQQAHNTVETPRGPSPAARSQPVELQPSLPKDDRALTEAVKRSTREVPQQREKAAPTRQRNARESRPINRLGSPGELRRAILHMTVIGPCRATTPHGSPDPAGPR